MNSDQQLSLLQTKFAQTTTDFSLVHETRLEYAGRMFPLLSSSVLGTCGPNRPAGFFFNQLRSQEFWEQEEKSQVAFLTPMEYLGNISEDELSVV